MTDQDTAPDARWLDDAQQRAWRAFLDMQARLGAQLGREMQASSGLSTADFAVLVALSEHVDGRLRILELARGLQWEKSRLSHQLSRMQQRGLIERSNCDEDRRGSYVVLTEQGRRAVEAAAPPHVEAVRRYVFDHLTPDEVATLEAISRGTLDRLATACAGKGDDDCPGVADDGSVSPAADCG